MKILLPIARAADPARRVRLTPDGQLDESAISWVINPLDEIALEQAVQWRERGQVTEIVAVSVGPAAYEEQLRAALARGADRAILVVTDGPLDARQVSHFLAALVCREQPDLVLTGDLTSDDRQAGPRLAGLLTWPLATQAMRIGLRPGSMSVTCETDTGLETLDLTLPAVVTVSQWLAAPRLLSLFAIVQARAKSVEGVPADELGPRTASQVMLVSLGAAGARPPVRMVADVAELITALREEARVI